MLDSVFIHGTSEGGMGVMPIGNALHNLGVKVTAYPAAVPSYDFTKSMMYKMGEMCKMFCGHVVLPFIIHLLYCIVCFHG